MLTNLFNLIPFALAYIMWVLGLSLTPRDFLTIQHEPRALVIGLISQMVCLPLLAFILVSLFSPPPAIAFGIMLLSFCAGGATSNLMSFYAGGHVALSVTLTALTSLACVVTLPVLVSVSFTHFMHSPAGQFSSGKLSLQVFVLTTLPVIIGMTMRHFLPTLTARIQPVMQKVVNVVFVLLVLSAVASNWQLMLKHFLTIGALVLLLAGLLLIGSVELAKWVGLPKAIQKTIGIETSLQNGAMGIALAPFIMASSAGGLPQIAVPSAVYGVLMNLIVLPYVWWCRHQLNITSKHASV